MNSLFFTKANVWRQTFTLNGQMDTFLARGLQFTTCHLINKENRELTCHFNCWAVTWIRRHDSKVWALSQSETVRLNLLPPSFEQGLEAFPHEPALFGSHCAGMFSPEAPWVKPREWEEHLTLKGTVWNQQGHYLARAEYGTKRTNESWCQDSSSTKGHLKCQHL